MGFGRRGRGECARIALVSDFDPLTMKVTWTPWLDGNDAYVVETWNEAWDGDGQRRIQFGPMPRDMIGPFIDERRDYISDFAARLIFKLSQRWSAQPNQK